MAHDTVLSRGSCIWKDALDLQAKEGGTKKLEYPDIDA